MSPERWQRLERIYQSAAETNPSDRGAYLREACAGDEELRREVESLLEQESRQGVLDHPVCDGLESLPVAQAEPLQPGQRIGRHEIRGKLGEGGMGVVYRAFDSTLHREVALKVLPSEFASDAGRRDRLLREARAASALTVPNIVTIYDVGSDHDVDFIAMELVQGRPLNEVFPSKGLPLRKALDYAIQIARGMAKAHAAGVIHRDLKPRNIMVTRDDTVKLLDFGLARNVNPEQPHNSLTAEGDLLGTPAYMSPEQAEGKPVDARSDIFSFGAILYEMLSGRPAFVGDSRAAVLASVLEKEPPPLSDKIPEALRTIVTRCLRKDPTRRFQHMDDLLVLLAEVSPDQEAAVSEGRGERRRRWTAAGAAVLLVSTVALAAWWLQRATPSVNLLAKPLISSPFPEGAASFSPDGRKVAFTWSGEKGDNPGIYVKQIGAATPPVQITKRGNSPSWSPDDRWIAFIRYQEGAAALILVSPLGGPERKLVQVRDTGAGGISWSPDGKWLAFSGRDSGDEPLSIWGVAVDTGERRRITTVQEEYMTTIDTVGDSSPAVSPDGSSLAYAHRTTQYSRVYVLKITHDLRAVGQPRAIADQKYNSIQGIAWTVNGSELVWGSGSRGSEYLWRASVARGADPVKLPFQPAALNPAIAHSSARLLYTWITRNSNLWRLDTRTGERKMLIGSSRFEHGWPEYSPDGRRIAFGSNRTGNWEVYTCDADGSNCVQLTFFDGPLCGTPRWSPDGRWLALDSFVKGWGGIYVMPSDGGTPRMIAEDGVTPVWSPDGQWIYFNSNRNEERDVWRISPSGGKAVMVAREGAGVRVSPDGKYLYYKRAHSRRLLRAPMQGGEETEVLPAVLQYYAVTAKGIYFTPDGQKIQLLDTATGEISTLAETSRAVGLTISPDDAFVVWPQSERSSTSLMMVEGFR